MTRPILRMAAMAMSFLILLTVFLPKCPAYALASPTAYGVTDAPFALAAVTAQVVVSPDPLPAPTDIVLSGNRLAWNRVDGAAVYEVQFTPESGEAPAAGATVLDPGGSLTDCPQVFFDLDATALNLDKGLYVLAVIAKPATADLTYSESLPAVAAGYYRVYAITGFPETLAYSRDVYWGGAAPGLPTQVEVTLDSGSASVNVDWDSATPTFDPNTLGTYVYAGTLATSGAIVNPGGIKARADIRVVRAPLEIKHPGNNLITWTRADGADEYKVSVYDSYIREVLVPQSDSPFLDLSSLRLGCGSYGILVEPIPESATNYRATYDTARYEVTATITDVPVVVIGTPFAVGTPLSGLNLPECVSVQMSNANAMNVSVTWHTEDYNGAIPDRYIITGDLTPLPERLSNNLDLHPVTTVYVDGNGSKEAPAIIRDAAELDAIRNESPRWPAEGSAPLRPYHKLVEDIDLASFGSTYDGGQGWLPLPIPLSMGNYGAGLDGNGHTIRNLYINRPSSNIFTDPPSNVGLFGAGPSTSSYEIKNLRIDGVDIQGGNSAGALLGEGRMIGLSITNCAVTGIQRVSANYGGGLVGVMELEYGQISGCSASGSGAISGQCTGGLVGYLNKGEITDSYAVVASTGSNMSGGLAGGNYHGKIASSYSAGSVTGGRNGCGGAVGSVGDGANTMVYYDSETSGHSETGRGQPLTTAQMKTMGSFVDWDFNTTWSVEPGTYPYLKKIGPVDLAPPVLTLPDQDGEVSGGACAAIVIDSDEPLDSTQAFGTLLSLNENNSAGAPVTFSVALTDAGTRLTLSTDWLKCSTVYYMQALPLRDRSGNRTKAAACSFVTTPGATIAPSTNIFEKLRPADLTFVVTWKSAKSLSLQLKDGTVVDSGAYSVDGNALTIYSSYLAAQALGDLELVAQYDTGDTSNLTVKIGQAWPRLVDAEADIGGKTVILTFDTEMADPSGQHGQFLLKAAGSDLKFVGASLSLANQKQIVLTVDEITQGYIPPGALSIQYLTGTVSAAAGDLLDAVNSYPVRNSVPFTSGIGYWSDPYVITTAAQLDAVRYNLDAYYKLGVDIDLNAAPYNAEEGWQPIGTADHNFMGVFDGDGHTVSGLYINRGTLTDVGLFGVLGKASVVKNVELPGVQVTGRHAVGALVGFSAGGSVRNCHISGMVTGSYMVGGLIGYSSGNIDQCSAIAEVSGDSPTGGLVGKVDYWLWDTPSNCYAQGVVYGSGIMKEGTGGLIGQNSGSNVVNCYAAVRVENPTGSYSGGLMGAAGSAPSLSYYDSTIAACSDNGKGTAKTTTEMMQKATFAGWRFDNVWTIQEGVTYPYLLGQNPIYFESGYPVAVNPSETRLDVNLKTNIAGTAHYVVLPDGALAPKASQIRAGLDSAGTSLAANLKGTVSLAAGEVVTATVTGLACPASYDIYLVLDDSAGRLQMIPAKLDVMTVDITPPVITLNGNNQVNVRIGGTYTELGVSAADNIDGDVTASVKTYGNVDTSVAGTYEITYRVSDAAGNEGSAKRTVIVYVSAPPAEAGPRLVAAETDLGGKTVILIFDRAMVDPSAQLAQFALYEEGVTANTRLAGVVLGADNKEIVLSLGYILSVGYIRPGTELAVSYSPGNVASTQGELLGELVCVPIVNRVAFDSGAGKLGDPYVIQNADQLNAIRYNLDAHYRLDADIDLGVAPYNAGWQPIGTWPTSGDVFDGVFDGGGHIISGLYINWQNGDPAAGLFGVIGMTDRPRRIPEIKNVELANVRVTGQSNVGALVGAIKVGAISNCHMSGIVNGGIRVGGLVGSSTGVIRGCSAIAEVSGRYAVGGLVGYVEDAEYWDGYAVENCYAQGRAAFTDLPYQTGGLVGLVHNGDVVNCYAAVEVGSATDGYKGGLLGRAYVTPYAPLGCYYDAIVAACPDNNLGEDKMTVEMMQKATFAGWDFSAVWDIQEGMTYPYLRGQEPLVWERGYPTVSDAAEARVKLSVKATVGGTAYFVVLPDAGAAPTASQIRAGQNAAGTLLAENLRGSVRFGSGNTGTAVITGLTYPGSYDIYLVAEDADGRLQMILTKIDASTADVTPPVITLKNGATLRLTVGDTYTEYGATAIDNIDGDVSYRISVNNGVDTEKRGTYKVVYSASDSCGNEATATRTVVVSPPEPTPSQVLRGAARSLTWERINGVNLGSDSVTQNLDLPRQLFGGDVAITWTSNNPAISPTGQVTRPAWGQGDAVVILTATLKHSRLTNPEVVTFTVVVPELEPTEEQLANRDLDAAQDLLTWETIQGDNASPDQVVGNLNLPTTIGNDVTITWNTDSALVADQGKIGSFSSEGVSRQVTITGILSKPGAPPRTVTFTVTIAANPGAEVNPAPTPAVVLNTVIGGSGYSTNGETVPFDAQTCFNSQPGISVMALRLFGAMGAEFTYEWRPDGGLITMSYGSHTVDLQEGSDQMTITDASGTRTVTLRTTVINRNGRAYIPTRDVSEYLGFNVDWRAEDDSITITEK